MDLIPETLLESEICPEGKKVTLQVPRYTDPVFSRLIQPRLKGEKRFIRLPLDPRGSWIWQQSDGRTKIGDMVAGFAAEFPDDSQDLAERLSGYLYNMWENKFIGFNNLK